MESTLVHQDTAVVMQCKRESHNELMRGTCIMVSLVSDTVGEVIRRGLGMLAHTSSSLDSTSPEGYRLKVCGKDEYLDK